MYSRCYDLVGDLMKTNLGFLAARHLIISYLSSKICTRAASADAPSLVAIVYKHISAAHTEYACIADTTTLQVT